MALAKEKATEESLALDEALGRLEEVRACLVRSARLIAAGQLISGVSHELNNALGVVSMYSELLPGASNEEKRLRYSEAVSEQAERAANIVSSLALFANGGAAGEKPVCINEVIGEVIDLWKPGLRSCGIVVRLDLASGLPPVMADFRQLQQVVFNLVGNAREAIRPVRRQGTVTIETRVDGDWVEMFVSDDGPGIPAPDMDRIFEPLYTTRSGGLNPGPGLSICRDITARYGGGIAADNRDCGGARFTVRMPAGVSVEDPASVA